VHGNSVILIFASSDYSIICVMPIYSACYIIFMYYFRIAKHFLLCNFCIFVFCSSLSLIDFFSSKLKNNVKFCGNLTGAV